jgi:site-specific DNA recombinase
MGTKRLVGYLRVSSADQALHGSSLEEQERQIRAWSEMHKKDYNLINLYIDDGRSGGSTDRPALQDLIRDSKADKLDAIAFTKLDRFGRSTIDLLHLWELLNGDLKKDIICFDPSIDTSTATGQFILTVFAGIATLERITIRDRTRNGLENKWRKDETYCGEAPFGYIRNEQKRLSIHEEQSQVVKMIFDLYLRQRLNSREIAFKLTQDGVKTPSQWKGKIGKGARPAASKWQNVTISDILRNSAYMGKVTQRTKIYVKGMCIDDNGKKRKGRSVERPESDWITQTCPLIIPEEEFRQAQDRIKHQRIIPKRKWDGYEDHFLLSGMIKCLECGSKARNRVKMEKSGKVRTYYVCHSAHAGPKVARLERKKFCDLPSIPADKADADIYERIIHVLTSPTEYFEKWLQEADPEDLKQKVEDLERAEGKLQHRLEAQMDHIAEIEDKEVLEVYRKQQRVIEDRFRMAREATDIARKELNQSLSKSRQLDEMKEELSIPKVRARLKSLLSDLDFKHRKAITEAVISPESGGGCLIGWIRPSDYLTDEEMKGMSHKKRIAPQRDRKPTITAHFSIDFDKIISIINSLDKSLLRVRAARHWRDPR